MNIIFYSMLALTIFLALSAGIIFVVSRSSSALAANTLTQLLHPRRTARVMPTAPAVGAKVLQFTRVLRASLNMTDNPTLQRQIDRAGLPFAKTRDTYFAARFGGPLLMLLVGSFSPYARLLCICAGVGIAYLVPAIVLGRLVKAHQEGVRLAVPDAIDLLVICVDAGLGLDQAMVRVGDELRDSHPAIHHEFAQISREQRAGKLRIEAWREMAARIQLPETSALVNMLMQTERFGTPIARALSSFSDTIRQKRRQRAEELAAKTTIKIIFPLVFFIFPCIFIVLLGPVVISFVGGLATSAH